MSPPDWPVPKPDAMIPQRSKILSPLLLIMLIAALTGCASVRQHSPPPEKLEAQVQMPGIPLVRMWGDEFSPAFQQDIVESIRQEERSGLFQESGTADILAISGGGGDGAFGAGMLCGWTANGTRPSFKMVTGISTGALTAPFAFLGQAYDEQLKKVYTSISTKDILELKSLFGMVWTDAIGLTYPLAKLTTQYVNENMLKDIAAEHAKGRRLFIGTTALDAQRPVVWNMGAIAASGHPGTLDLFRKIMIASPAVPVAFPPVYFSVEADGKSYDEMHVDGGVSNQVFLYGSMLNMTQAKQEAGAWKLRRKVRVFVIRNTRIKPLWQDIRPLIRSIARRSVSSLIRAQGVGDLYHIYTLSQRDGLDFNLAYIPDAVDVDRSEEFNTEVMNALFDTGYKLALHGYRWFKTPPGLINQDQGNRDAESMRHPQGFDLPNSSTPP